jgi:hypothetical protein
MHRLLLVAALALAACGPKKTPSTSPASGQMPAMPTAESLFEEADLAHYDDGKPRWVSSRTVMTGTMMNVGVTLTTEILPNNQTRMTTAMAGIGEIVKEYDGTHGWETHPLTGARLLPPEEIRGSLDLSDPTMLPFGARFPDATIAGREVFDGVDCYRVESTSVAGRSTTLWFEADTKLLRGTASVAEMGGQQVNAVNTFHDYKSFDGIQSATVITTTIGEMEMVLTVQEVVMGWKGEPVTPSADVQALLDGMD